jgi:hypothetical protein
MSENDKWTCGKCGNINDPSGVRVSGFQMGGGSFSSMVQDMQRKGVEEQEKLKKFCGKCGAPRPTKACFIATATYGSPLAPEVQLLRDYRDEELALSPAGRWFIRLYEKSSPPLAEWIEQHTTVRRWVLRFFLIPIVSLVRMHRQKV